MQVSGWIYCPLFEPTFGFGILSSKGNLQMDMKAAQSAVSAQVQKLVDAAVYSTDLCTVAKLIAVKDSTVQTTLATKLAEGNVFKGVVCSKRPSIPELVTVVFQFDCPEGAFCLVPPTFAASVDMVTKEVKVIDPYMGSFTQHQACRCSENEIMTKQWYAACETGHVIWTGPYRDKYKDAQTDATNHDKAKHGGSSTAVVIDG